MWLCRAPQLTDPAQLEHSFTLDVAPIDARSICRRQARCTAIRLRLRHEHFADGQESMDPPRSPRGPHVLVVAAVLLQPESVFVDPRRAVSADGVSEPLEMVVTRPRPGLLHTVDRCLPRRAMAHAGNHIENLCISVSCWAYATAYHFLYGLRSEGELYKRCSTLNIFHAILLFCMCQRSMRTIATALHRPTGPPLAPE